MSAIPSSTLATLRRMLLGLLGFGLLGSTAELWLLGHYEDWRQVIPLAVMGASALATAWLAYSWSVAAARVFRLCMLLLMLSGATGSVLHYRANREFQWEMDPSLRGVALWSKVLHSKVPPALAPGNLALLGLLGLVGTFRLTRTT